jgi:hypothetical protein
MIPQSAAGLAELHLNPRISHHLFKVEPDFFQ